MHKHREKNPCIQAVLNYNPYVSRTISPQSEKAKAINKWVYLSELTDVFFVCSLLFSLLFASGANPVCRPGLANCKDFKALAVRP